MNGALQVRKDLPVTRLELIEISKVYIYIYIYTERQRETERERDRDRDRERDRERQSQTERDRERDREIHTQNECTLTNKPAVFIRPLYLLPTF